MAEIHVEPDVVWTVAKQLTNLAHNQDDVKLTHGPTGIVFVVPDVLAEAWASKIAVQDEPTPAAPKKKGK